MCKETTQNTNHEQTIIIVFVLIVSVSCDKENIENLQIDGVRIEKTHKTDTIVFDITHSWLTLKRGSEIEMDIYQNIHQGC